MRPEYDCKVYIETGLKSGDQLALSAHHFQVAHGIELNDHFYEVTKARLAPLAHVHVHHGDSRALLNGILEPYANQSCFFYLDAHYCPTNPPIPKTEFPLWAELEIIRKRNTKDIIVIDDADIFGQCRPNLKFSETSVDWEGVTKESIIAFFGSRAQDNLTIRDTFVLWKANP